MVEARGIAKRAGLVALEGLGVLGPPRTQHHLYSLSAFKKATFGGDVPRAGHTGSQFPRIIEELSGLGAIAAKPPREAA